MQEAEEQDTCRICSAPAEEGQPLFHPCKCSGTIRYIHQDCLTTWLSHSKKKSCDVCKHPYSFTKVYASNMPTSLPTLLLVKKLIQQVFFALLFGLRGIAVGIIWLTALPWATVWTWRMYFSMGESTAWWISGNIRPPSTHKEESPFYQNLHPTKLTPQPTSFLGRLTSHPVWVALSTDIFTGQIIASLIVLTFVAVFLLREWISQNARPGVFDDDNLAPEGNAAPRPEARPPAGPPQQPHPLEEALARRQVETMLALEALQAHEAHGRVFDGEKAYRHARLLKKKKARRSHRKERSSGEMRSATRRRLAEEDDEEEEESDYEEERIRRMAFSRRVHSARIAGTKRKMNRRSIAEESSESVGLPLQVDPTFQFTFVPPQPATTSQPSPRPLPFTFDGVNWVPSSSGTATDDNASLSTSSVPGRSSPPTSSRVVSFGPFAEGSSLAGHDISTESIPAAGPSHSSSHQGKDEGEYEEFNMYFRELESTVRPETPSEDDSDKEEVDGDEEGDIDNARQDGDEHVDVFEQEEDEEEEPGAMEDFVFDAWEAAEEHGEEEMIVEAEGAAPPENIAVAPPPQGEAQNLGPALQIPPDLAEELEGNVEDDMEGAMEAIGMRGPIYGVLQNAALMIFVMDTAIGLGIWIPFTIGKTTALLSLNPPRVVQILHLPIRAIRIITDPFVDGLVFLILDILVPSFLRAIFRTTSFLFTSVLWLTSPLYGQKLQDDAASVLQKLGEEVVRFSENPWEEILAWTAAPANQATYPTGANTSKYFDRLMDIAEPYFAPFGENVRLSYKASQSTWERLAIGERPSNRAFAIVLGYAIVGLVLAVYLNFVTPGNAPAAGRAVRIAIRQQLLVLKVATFIFIELISFPLSCGIVLDLCTVWFFPDALLATRVAFFTQAPLTALFYHWVGGTMFMYAFAVILSGCRSVMRPGAMWFIKDPQDVNSHPIREILDRSTIIQLKKITVSGLMYSCVVACVVGSVASLLKLGHKSVLPLRWKNRRPLSNVPIDLLFLHIVLPYTMHYFRPKKALKAATTVVWKFVAKQLRLTSYFFGDRHPEEERFIRWRFTDEHGADVVKPDGSFRRVPATDNIVLPRDMRVTVAVHADGQPVDEAAQTLLTQQNVEIQRAGRAIKDEFAVVYIPPHFRYRIFSFIGVMWVIGSFALGIALVLPVLLGRRFFEMFTREPVHDGYSLIIGFYLLWGFYLVGSSIDRLDRRRQRTFGERHRGQDLPIVVLKRGAVFIVKSLYMALFLGVVIPTLISFVIDLYIVLPIRITLDPGLTPRIRVVDTWALGLVYVKIALHAVRIQAPNQFSHGIQHILQNGWSKSDPIQATREVIGPLAGGLIGMILFPGLVFRAMQYMFPNIVLDDKFIFMHIYPGIFMLAGLVRSGLVLYGLLGTWSQSVRDKEFLVEMRLRNHEPDKEGSKGNHTAVADKHRMAEV